MKIGLLGYGYTASFFSQWLVKEGYCVWGTSRDKTALPHFVPSSVNIIKFDDDEIKRWMMGTIGLLISIPPSKMGDDPAFTILHDHMVSNKSTLQWIGYLSSTGVYGDHQGHWVTEQSLCAPTTTRAKNRQLTEKLWLSLYTMHGLPVMIFRLSGIYGPGRNVLDRLRLGKHTSVLKKGHYFSRIHVRDICNTLLQSMLLPAPGSIFNVSDDCPSAAYEVEVFASDLLRIERPSLVPYQEAFLSAKARAFYEDNRRVSNAKLKFHLVPQLCYPSYKEGLRALLLSQNRV